MSRGSSLPVLAATAALLVLLDLGASSGPAPAVAARAGTPRAVGAVGERPAAGIHLLTGAGGVDGAEGVAGGPDAASPPAAPGTPTTEPAAGGPVVATADALTPQVTVSGAPAPPALPASDRSGASAAQRATTASSFAGDDAGGNGGAEDGGAPPGAPVLAPAAVEAERSYALLIGVDRYANARDLSTAVADATTLGDVLLASGWRSDHIRVLADPDATTVRAGLEWLAANAGSDSTVVVSFSGHTRQRGGDPDGDGEAFDEGWWTSDGSVVWDAEIGQRLAAIRAGRLWLTIQACEAGGYDDPGTLGPGRLVTWSSLEEEKSFEDPEAGFSTQAHRLVAEGLRDGWGDADGDGAISVQEAAAWSAPRVHIRTDGRQSPQVHDELDGPLLLDAR